MSVGGVSENASPVRLLAICKSADSIRPAITFLARRGVHITCVTSIHDALAKIAEHVVDYVFLSVSFPHSKLETIPPLFLQTFQIETVYFSEKWDRRSEARIANLRHKHVIYGPLTGPSVLLKIRQLQKAEAEERAKAAQKPAAPSLGNMFGSSQAIKVSGGRTDDSDIHLKNAHATPEAIAKLMQMLGEGEQTDASAELFEEMSENTNPGVIINKGAAPRQFAIIPSEHNNQRGCYIFKRDPRIAKSPFKQSLEAAKQNTIVLKAEPQTAKVLPFKQTLGAPLKRVPEKVQGHAKLYRIWEAARRAVMDVSRAIDVYDTAIIRVQNLALLSIHTKAVDGCFLLSIGQQSSAATGMLVELQHRFLFHLRDSGESIEDSEYSVIEIDTSTLPDGSFIDSDFSITAYTELAEVSISFLDIKHEGPVIEPSALEDFSKIKVKDIATGVPLTFDAFIYMPLNQKTLKYLKQGGVLGLKQKSKLMDDGTEHLYIKDYSVGNFKEFHARTSLQEEFEKRKETAKKKAA